MNDLLDFSEHFALVSHEYVSFTQSVKCVEEIHT